MVTYIWRQELAPVLAIDPVLHYYPLLACRQEPRAPVSVWKGEDGAILGAVVPCDPPGRAWLMAGCNQAAAELAREVPADTGVSFPHWAEEIVAENAPSRSISTDVLAVCTPSSLCQAQIHKGFRIQGLEQVPGADAPAAISTSVRVAHLGCVVEGTLAGFCTYHLDGHGCGSVDRLSISEEWRGADIGKTLLSAAAAVVLQEAERVVFAAAGDNIALLGAARASGFRTSYWLKYASPTERCREAGWRPE
jgi:GNAT superfamily N-acetyltransferase